MIPVLRREGAPLGLLLLTCLLTFCAFYRCWSWADWHQPLFIQEDVPLLAGYLQAASEGNAYPLLPHMVERLNAPFVANWADFPTTEELIYGYGGLLTRLTGWVAGYNLCLLTAHLSAAAAFYAAARALASRPVWAVLGGVAFASSRFMFVRDRVHLNLTFCWHLPLFWVAAVWLYEGRPVSGWRKPALAALCLVTGWQHPYYWYFWLMLLLPALVRAWLRRDRATGRALGFTAALSGLALALAQVDSVLSWWAHGKSQLAWERTLAELQLYGLRLPEFFLPLDHRLQPLERWSWLHYYKPMFGHAQEVDSSYLGALGIAGLVWMVARSVRRLRSQPGQGLEPMAVLCAWILLLAVNGGFHFLAGSLGLLLFRCSCRFSVLLLAGWLLYLCQRLSDRFRNRSAAFCWALCAVGVALALWDQLPPAPSGDQRDATRATLANHQATVSYLESTLPPRSMVFQWPVTGYPETPPREKLGHYEEMLGYLLSHTLRFSYGDCRGRPESQWQGKLEGSSPRQVTAAAEGYGFQALWLYTRGLKSAELAAWKAERPPDFVSPERDLWIYRLSPTSNHPAALPPLLPCAAFNQAFYEPEQEKESSWRWAAGPAEVALLSPGGRADFSFGLSCYGSPRRLQVWLDGRPVWSGELQSGAEHQVAVRFSAELTPGNHRLELVPAGSLPPRSADGRFLVFCLHDWRLTPGGQPADRVNVKVAPSPGREVTSTSPP